VSPVATKPRARAAARGNGVADATPPAGNGAARRRKTAVPAPAAPDPAPADEVLIPDSGAWRTFVGRWLENSGCQVGEAARGDWEVVLSPVLQRRWRRQRVRLVFDPLRATLPRGAWFMAPGSTAGRKVLDAAREEALVTRRTALPRVPGAPEEGIAAVCRVRGLSWGPARLGPVSYERRIAFHAVVTLWGGLPAQESWVLLLGPDGPIESVRGSELADMRSREGLYQISEDLEPEERGQWADAARRHLDELLAGREREWESAIARLRDDELARLSAFFAARVEEEEERSRRRTGNGDEHEMEGGDVTSLKLEWERRSAEVRQRWSLRTEIRIWGIEEWAWPVAELEQELRAGAMHVRLTSRVDVARGRPALPACPGCGAPAEMLVRARGAVGCVRCA
jgi:hypothetical protein